MVFIYRLLRSRLLQTTSVLIIYHLLRTMAILNDVFYLTTRLCTPIGVAFGMVLIGWAAVQYLQVLKQRGSLPPGPFPWPLVGNTLQLSRSKPWLQFQQWSRENRNGLLTIWIGYKPHIICNDAWSASELMEKRYVTSL